MSHQAFRIGKKGGAKRVAEELAKVRKAPMPKEVNSILKENKKREQGQPLNESTKHQRDIDL